MGLNPRKIRFVRKDTRLKTRSRRSLVSDGGNCPSITLGDLDGDLAFKGNACELQALIDGPLSEYSNPTVVSGTAPTGMTFDIENIPDEGSLLITGGTYNAFGIFTFSIQLEDSNGCLSTPREYTVEVWQRNTNYTPQTIEIGNNDFLLPVSGLPNPLSATNGYSLELNLGDSLLSTFDIYLFDPSDTYGFKVVASGSLTDGLMTGTIFIVGAVDNIVSSSPPYTGNFDPTLFSFGFADLAGANPNGNWIIRIDNQSGVQAGQILSYSLTFKP